MRDTAVINAKEFRAFIDSNLDASSRFLQQLLHAPLCYRRNVCPLLYLWSFLTQPCSTLRATLSGGGGGSGRESRDFANAVSRKVCVLGYMGVGKSSLTIQYAHGTLFSLFL